MVDFVNLWGAASAKMDEAVDRILGDIISYSIDGITFVDVSGFVIDVGGQQEGYTGLDEPLGTRPRVKVAKSIVANPVPQHRLMHPRLGGGKFRPCGAEPLTQGRYWIFDVQKASA